MKLLVAFVLIIAAAIAANGRNFPDDEFEDSDHQVQPLEKIASFNGPDVGLTDDTKEVRFGETDVDPIDNAQEIRLERPDVSRTDENKEVTFDGLDGSDQAQELKRGTMLESLNQNKVSGDETTFDQWESMAERKSCTPKAPCTKAGGHCVKFRVDCEGTVDPKGCRGGKKCMCCIPDQTTLAPTTCAEFTCPVVTSCPTTAITSCPNVTCPVVTMCPSTTTATCPPTTPCPISTPTTCPPTTLCPNTTCPPTTLFPTTTPTTCPTSTPCPTTTPISCPPITYCPTTTPTTCPPATPCPTTTPTGLECPESEGFFWFGNQCFKRFTVQRQWTDAKNMCLSEDLILAEPSDSLVVALNTYLSDTYGGDVWIGARGVGTKVLWQHSIGFEVKRNNSLWESSENFGSIIGQCLEINRAKSSQPYDLDFCSTSQYPLCERLNCPSSNGFFWFANQCFKKFTDSTRNWEDSNLMCLSEGLTLAQPSDSIVVALNTYLVDTYGVSDVWIGARGVGSKVMWQHSGTELSQDNPLWESGESFSTNMDSQCLEINCHASRTGPYDLQPCTSSQYTLCEMNRK